MLPFVVPWNLLGTALADQFAHLEPDDLLPRATELAQQLSALDMNAHRGSKARVREPLMAAISTAFEREALAQ